VFVNALLEYDDVMNAQRESSVQTSSPRLVWRTSKLDIANMLYDTCELIVQNTKQLMISKLEFDLIRYFSITSPISETILQNYRNGADWKVYTKKH
jgi:preprotein translocase subunit SecA